MRTGASIAGHPIHPMLVSLPIGLFVCWFVCDLAFVRGSGNPAWSMVTFYSLGGVVVGALVAAVFRIRRLVSLACSPGGLQ